MFILSVQGLKKALCALVACVFSALPVSAQTIPPTPDAVRLTKNVLYCMAAVGRGQVIKARAKP